MATARIFKSAWFARFAKKEDITDAMLLDVVECAEKGQIDAYLGGGVVKQRVARPGEGKSGGYRVIVFYRDGARVIFQYGFAKNEKDNIDSNELKTLKAAAKILLALDDKQISAAIKNKTLVEVKRK